MKTTFISLLISAATGLALLCAMATSASANPLDPNGFPSLGANPFTLAGSYTIDTATTPPVLTRPNATTVNGVVSGGIAVFTFDNITIAAGMTVNGLQNSNSRPFALLSHSGIANSGTINVSGTNGAEGVIIGPDSDGGRGGNGGNAGPGGGGGGGGGRSFVTTAVPGSGGLGFVNGTNGSGDFGGNGGSVEPGGGGRTAPDFNDGGGGAFGGNGGNGFSTNAAAGGTAYGNLGQRLEGGSGGAGSSGSDHFGGNGGGGGGGAVELGASGTLVLTGTGSVMANGGTGITRDFDSGGGGGGGIFIHAQTVSLSGSLSAIGGDGGNLGGGGGGGRVLILTASGTLASGSLSNINVSGGSSFENAGSNGVATITNCPAIIVTNTSDGGPGSLREAVNLANACPGRNIIEFAPSAYGTIMLIGGELLITDDLCIFGPGATNVTVSGPVSRVFHVSSNLVVTIAGLTIANAHNLASSGGGIFNDRSTLTVSNCVLSGNAAARGGGIYNNGHTGILPSSATLNVINSTFSGNLAGPSGGGGIYNDGTYPGEATVTLVNCTLSGNSASGSGGGIYNESSAPGLPPGVNGPGVPEIGGGRLTVLNSTFSSNSAAQGPGIFAIGLGGTGGLVQIGSTVLKASGIRSFSTTITSLGYNLSSDNGGDFPTNKTDQINTDPLLGSLQLNGGQTPTHALLCGSPAIDHGTNFTGSATDQRGLPRTFDDAGISNVGDGTDTGAFERQTICNNPPVALCTNVTVSANSNCVANASVDNGSYDPDPGDSITNRMQSPPGPYALGTNMVIFTVTDSHGASSLCMAKVFVVDTTRPNITSCAAPVTNSANASCQGSVPNFTTNVIASDNCPGALSITQAPAAGTTVGLGTTNVTIYVVDHAGNTNTCSTSFTVVDTTMPNITGCAAPVTNSANASCQAGVPDFTTNVAASDNCTASGALSITQYPAAGTTVGLGTTNVTIYVADHTGNTNTCSTSFTVVDRTPPSITCPSNIVTTNDTGQCSVVVSYTVSATDNCGAVTNISEDFPSGSTFSTGTNTVHVTAVDNAGNTNTCSFTVTVLDGEAPLVTCRPAPNPSGKVSEPGKNGSSGVNPNGYYQLLSKDNCDGNPSIYVKDTKSSFVAGPFHDGDIVRLKRAGGAPSSVPGTAPVVAVISLKGNGLSVATDAGGNTTPDASGCAMAVAIK